MTKTYRILALLLRLLALGATISATIVMDTSHDSNEVLNIKFTAKYSNSTAFKYFVIANAVVSGYSFVILILDAITTVLLSSYISAALAIAQVGQKGNTHTGWLPICGQVPKFCDHASGSLVAGFVAAIVYLSLHLYSLHTAIGSWIA